VRTLINYLRAHWLWLPIWIFSAVILIALVAEFPLGASFIHPLRNLYFDLRKWLYFPLIIIITLTATQAIPYWISSRISKLDAEGRFIDHYIPPMRPFLILLVLSIITFTVFSGNSTRPNTLESVKFNDHRYYLMVENNRVQYDRYLLYQCDSLGVICQSIFSINGSVDYTTIQLVVADDTLSVMLDGEIIHTLD